MPETFLILLASGIMLAAAISDPLEVTLQWLRLAGIIALTMLGLGGFFFELGARATDLMWFGLTVGSVLGQLGLVQVAKRDGQRVLAGAACGLGLITACRWLNGPIAFLGGAGVAAMTGLALMTMLLGHAYLTASKMSMKPFFRLTYALIVAIILRAISSTLVALVWNSRHPVEMLFPLYGLYILTRWLVGLIVPAVFIYMTYDCIKRRATQSATGILYVAGLMIFIGELLGLYLVKGTSLPF